MRRRLLIALTLVLALAGTTAAEVQAAVSPKLIPIGRLRFPARGFLVDFGRHVAVPPSSIRVLENGRPVEDPSFVPAGDSKQRLAAVLVVDTSNSMRGRPLRAAYGAARTFAGQLGAGKPVGLVTFDARAWTALAPSADRAALARALHRHPRTHEGTHIYDAVARAIAELRNKRVAAGSVVLLSDGADTGSRADAARVAALARAAHVRVFTVGLRSPAFRPAALRRLASATGGGYSEARSAAQLHDVYGAIGARLASEYLLRYRSKAAVGEHVRVVLEVPGGGSSSVSYKVPKSATVAPFHRSPLEGFWASPGAFVVIALLAAGLIFAAALMLLRGPRSNLRERLAHFIAVAERQEQAKQRISLFRRGLFQRTDRSLGRTKWWPRFKEELELAEIKMAPEVIVIVTAVATAFALVVLALISPIFCIFALGIPFVSRALCRRKLRKLRDRFGEQLPDSLQLLASALRAGHSFVAALSIVAADAEMPSRREFQRVVADEQLGVRIEDSLREVARRMANPDLEQVALVAEVQRQAGGNMAEVLDRVIDTVRGRFDLRRLVKTLTAQGRMARWIISLLPVALLVTISVVNPGYESVLYSSTGGQVALAGAAVLVIAGSLVIKKIVDIKV